MAKITVLISEALEARLEAECRATGRSRSDVVREALGRYLETRPESRLETCLELARRIGVVGHAADLDAGLSVDRTRFNGFGEDR